jgi:hypothetical protein
MEEICSIALRMTSHVIMLCEHADQNQVSWLLWICNQLSDWLNIFSVTFSCKLEITTTLSLVFWYSFACTFGLSLCQSFHLNIELHVYQMHVQEILRGSGTALNSGDRKTVQPVILWPSTPPCCTDNTENTKNRLSFSSPPWPWLLG